MVPERKVLSLLCLLAAIRVFVFSAAFPCFNNVDEDAHFDLAIKYSRANFPRRLEPYSVESAQFIALYGTSEYIWKPEQFGGKYPPPLWTLPSKQFEQVLPGSVARLTAAINYESGNPPLYYVVAGLWIDAGRLIGLNGGLLLYWLRFLNVIIIVALVWLGYSTAKLVFPERSWIWRGVGLVLACFPQDIFFSIQNDALSPLCFGAAFFCVLRLTQSEVLPVRLAATTGLALASCWLAKTSNLPLIIVALGAIFLKLIRISRAGKLGIAVPAVAALAVSAGLPVVLWMVWSRHAFGDITGASEKTAFLGWTHKPFAMWWNHPLFSVHGALLFWRDLMASFWRGEFVWHGERLASSVADVFYWGSSAVVMIGGGYYTSRNRNSVVDPQRRALWFALASVAGGIAFLAIVSLMFDFGACYYPSPQYPYFTSGRLISGALVPFALLFVFSADRLLTFMKTDGYRLSALATVMAAITVSEFVVSWPVFSSPYNWFHFFL